MKMMKVDHNENSNFDWWLSMGQTASLTLLAHVGYSPSPVKGSIKVYYEYYPAVDGVGLKVMGALWL